MPAKSNHLVQRSTTWHVRIDVPADLRHAFGNRRILSKSLKTGDKMLAKTIATQVIGQWKASFRSIRDAKLAKGDAWREELADNAKALGARIDNSLLSAIKNKPHPSDPFFALSEAEQNAKLSEAAADLAKVVALLYRDGATSLPSELIPSLEAAQKGDSIGFLSSALSTLPTAPSQIIARHYNLSPTEAAEALSIAIDPKTYKPKSPISAGAIAAFRQHTKARTTTPALPPYSSAS
ncbi:DUF6538 domain-containing protein [Pseudomonas cavernicola]|nr:DUF6538 domain-containing protein [Pseudomonas cavernicola]